MSSLPQYWEYVFSAYGLWGVTFLAYWIHLVRKSRALAQATEQLSKRRE